jgi:hypothetical protein
LETFRDLIFYIVYKFKERKMLGGINGIIIRIHAEARRNEEKVLQSFDTMLAFVNEKGAKVDELEKILDYSFNGKVAYKRITKKDGHIEKARARLLRGYGGFKRYLIVYEINGDVFFRIAHSTVKYGLSLSERKSKDA